LRLTIDCQVVADAGECGVDKPTLLGENEMKSLIPLYLASGLIFICAPSVYADKQVSTAFDQPVRVDATVDTSGCKNSGGPTVTFGGKLSLGGLNARVTFSNNAKGTHTATVLSQFDVTLLPEGSAIEIPQATGARWRRGQSTHLPPVP
jgi:hypothetical protein